jgi:ParB family chromosome partitioning protein
MRPCCYVWRAGRSRTWQAIEEAALIFELSRRHSLREIAVSLARDVSWVSRRLSLFQALPGDLLEAVRQGKLSLWAASRILAPLARANTAHARLLWAQLEQHPLSTRELKRLYSHYKQANPVQRQRLAQAPRLFFQALETHEQTTQAKRLADGPEGVQGLRTWRLLARSSSVCLSKCPLCLPPNRFLGRENVCSRPLNR